MKYFMFNHSGCTNHGCEAIIRGTINILENSDNDCSFMLSSFSPEADKDLPNVDVFKFEPRALTKAETIVAWFEYKFKHSDTYALKKMYSIVLEQANEADICLSVGGDTYCYGDNHTIQALTDELKKNGKKVVLWGASVGEEDLTDEKLKSFATFDAVFARENLTYNLLEDKNANNNIFLYADPAFCMEREEETLPAGFTKENTIGINVSPLIAKSNPKIFEATKAFVSYVIENTTLNILFIPHVVEKDNNDYDFMLPIFESFEKTGRVAILPPTLNAMQYKGYIAKLRFFIGARTHATIAAYSSGVPTFVIGYSVKSLGIAEDLFGNDDYVLNINDVESSEQLVDAFNILIKDENKIKEILMRKIPAQLRSAMQMGNKLVNL